MEHDLEPFPSAHHHHDGARVQRVRVAAAVVRDGERVLLTQRPPGGPLGLHWEFPGGKIEEGESPEHALIREIHEELGVVARVHGILAVECHDYPHGLEVEIVFMDCTLDSTAFRESAAIHATRWVNPRDVRPDEVLAADRLFLVSLASGAHPVRR
jgi:8-oxo-dGTP diphosphatase